MYTIKIFKRETTFILIHFETSKLRHYETDLTDSFFVVFVSVRKMFL